MLSNCSTGVITLKLYHWHWHRNYSPLSYLYRGMNEEGENGGFSFFIFHYTLIFFFLVEVWIGLLPNLSSVDFGSFQIEWCYFGVSGGESSSYPDGTHYPKWSDYFSTLNIRWKDWCWSWSSNTLATWCKEPTHWKRPWCWERLKAGGEGDNGGQDGWMASSTQWT